MATAFKQKNFRIPLELAEKLEEKAKQTGLTETEIVIKALQEYLEKEVKDMFKTFAEFQEYVTRYEGRVPTEAIRGATKRVQDWLQSGGDIADPYVTRQIKYLEQVAKLHNQSDEED